ncbi:MAG: hypothetical protein RPU64_09315 [Candidatus Sedimenticola sp. (ex Thyasira tokunagai)]
MRITVIALLLFLTTITTSSYAADSDNEQLQKLVDQLKEVTEKARDQRAADRWLLNALEDLVEQYNWPWRTQLVMEDFSDGDFQQDPAWQVRSGQFWVDGRLGLRSRSRQQQVAEPKPEQPQQRREKEDIGKALLGALLQGALQKRDRQQQATPPPAAVDRYQSAEIQLPVAVPSVFAAELELSVHNAPSEEGEIEFGLYQGAEGNSGYRLVLYTGRRASLELLSRRSGRTGVIDRVDIDDIGDGNSHQLQWRRDANGQIEVLLDGNRVIRARDHSFRYPFKQFAITNNSGDFAVAGISLYGGN